MIGFAFFAALLSPAAASLVLKHNATGWEKPAIKHRLRVCNAYPSSHALRVLKNNKEFMGESQMKYKECTEFKGTLNEGDRLNFQADDSIPLSTFTVNDLPKEQSTLLLVAYRESKDNTKIAFKSHIFTVAREAQLAVIDTFQGETKTKLSISEFRCNRQSTGSAPALQIPMKFSTVMALESGIYEVKINSGAKTHSVGPFAVADGEDYVVLRTGLDDVESVSRHAKPSDQSFLLSVAPIDPPRSLRTDHGESLEQFVGLARVGSYPQEFVIHPLLKSVQNPCPAAKDEHSGATAIGSLTALAVAILTNALL
jgi:hypothetical protein